MFLFYDEQKTKRNGGIWLSSGIRRRSLAAAFPYTIPIMAGFLFLGMAYGITMHAAGFSFLYPTIMAMVIFGGSLEFVAVSMLLSPFAPLTTFLAALMIQARHLFYGLSMLEKFQGLGLKKWYLIFGMCDETYSINCTAYIPAGADRGWFYFFVTLLNHLYWICGAMMGGLLGRVLPFDTEGLDFVMTAMFVVIFLEQWKKEKSHITAGIGLGAALVCRILFGAVQFLIPAMGLILLLLTMFRKPVAQAFPKEEEEGQ